jgi:penicillin-binding protein 2
VFLRLRFVEGQDNIVPNRGKILGRNGIELAVNVVSYFLISSGHRREISWEEVESKALKNNIVAFYKNSYPFGSICSHILGYTRRETNKQVGISGIEYVYNDILEGICGKIEQELNSKQYVVSDLGNVDIYFNPR